MKHSIFKLTEWVSRLALLNLLWIGFTLVGFVIFGFFPATVAMFSVIRQWLRGRTDLPLFRYYFQAFRAEFFKANGYGLLIMLLGLIVYADLIFLSVNPSPNRLLFQVPLYLFLLFASLTLLYLYPVYVHYKLDFFKIIKQAFLIMLIHPFQTIAMVLGIATTMLVMYFIPALIIFFSGSFTALIIMATCYHAFLKIEQKQKKISKSA